MSKKIPQQMCAHHQVLLNKLPSYLTWLIIRCSLDWFDISVRQIATATNGRVAPFRPGITIRSQAVTGDARGDAC